jgi:ATP-dependent DNA helicase PIF1
MTQKEALDMLKTGANVFLTGPAGSGKTYVLREYLKCLYERDIPVGITASTGIAATHMGGVTIHSWSGIGVKDSISDAEMDEIAEKSQIKNKIQAAKVLIIDEISMLHHFRLDLVNAVTKRIRRSEEPFGGLQVVVCGDFFQLPPVSRAGEPDAYFAYHSRVWKEANFVVCYLEEQHRQIDREFVGILNAIRAQAVSSDMLDLLEGRITSSDARAAGEAERVGETIIEYGACEAEIKPTRLYSHNADVDAENERELAAVPGQIMEYHMASHGNKRLVEGLKKYCLAPEILRIKKGAQVMFVKNNRELGYANGTRGAVIDCGYDHIIVRTLDGREIDAPIESWRVDEGDKTLAEIEQYPLRLAWAITIHKSQGMSLDAAHIDLTRSFEKGMGYVALSRVRSLLGLTLVGLNDTALNIHPEAFEFDRYFREQSKRAQAYIMSMSSDELKEKQRRFLGDAPNKESAKARKPKKQKISRLQVPTTEITRALIDEGKSIREVAAERGLSFDTILRHIEEEKEKDPRWDISHLRDALPVTRFRKIAMAFHAIGVEEGGKRLLSPVKNKLGSGFTFEEIRLVRLFL